MNLHGLLNSYVNLTKLANIVEREDIIFYTFPFAGRLKERYVSTNDGIVQIAIDSNINKAEQKHMIAHALGHHFLHQGNYAHIDGIVQDKQEYQADVFASVLLVPPAIFQQAKPSTVSELAHAYNIPIILAERRIEIFKVQNI